MAGRGAVEQLRRPLRLNNHPTSVIRRPRGEEEGTRQLLTSGLLGSSEAAMLLQGGNSAVFLLLIHFLEPTVVLTFNVETGHVIRKNGDPETLFGFSLALHRQVNPDKVM